MTITMHHAAFALLTKAEQSARVRKLAAARWPDHDIARLTGWRVEMVREALAAGNRPGEVGAAGSHQMPNSCISSAGVANPLSMDGPDMPPGQQRASEASR